MTYTSSDGYRTAAKIDRVFNKILQEHNTDDLSNRDGYLALIRTIHTTLNCIRPQVGLLKAGTHMETVVPE